jgi:hypothetical protein
MDWDNYGEDFEDEYPQDDFEDFEEEEEVFFFLSFFLFFFLSCLW